MSDRTDLETYGAVRCLYAAAHDIHPRDVDRDDAGCSAVADVLAARDAVDIAELSRLLGLPPDEERDGEGVALAIQALRLEVHQARIASLRAGNQAVGGTVHHIDGDPHNNDPANLVRVEMFER